MLNKRLYIQVFKEESEFIVIFYDGTKSYRALLLLLMFIYECVNDYIYNMCLYAGERDGYCIELSAGCIVCPSVGCVEAPIISLCFDVEILCNAIASNCPWAVSVVLLCVASKLQLFICVLMLKERKRSENE